MQLTQVQQGSTIVASYTYDANGNRATMVTSAGTTTYTYDSADVLLVSKTDPNGKVTNYTYDSNGNLTSAVYDPGGTGHLNQTTTYKYDTNNRLIEVDEPNGTIVTFTYDADGNRLSKTVNGMSINDVYAQGRLDHQTDSAGTILATFTYDTNGTPASVVVGNPTSGTRYYYVYNAHGDVVALVDTNGTVQASYSYDAFGALTSSSESLANGWSNPYRYDGAELVRDDPETNLYWMRVRAYDPTLGRFISHDPLGRLAVQGLDTQPYVYASNNPVNGTDPSGMFCSCTGPDGHSPSWWANNPNAPDADGCVEPLKRTNYCGWEHPLPPPLAPPSDCDSTCLATGQRWLNWGAGLLANFNSPGFISAIADGITWIPVVGLDIIELFGGNFDVIPELLSGILHTLRDATTFIDLLSKSFRINSFVMQIVHLLEIASDILTPIADVVAVLSIFGGGGAITGVFRKLFGNNPVLNLLKTFSKGNAQKWLIGLVAGADAANLFAGTSQLLQMGDPVPFCEALSSLCHSPFPSWAVG